MADHPFHSYMMVTQKGAVCTWECKMPGCHATKVTFDGKGSS